MAIEGKVVAIERLPVTQKATGLTVVHALEKSPVVYTCGVSVLQGLRRTKAVLRGL